MKKNHYWRPVALSISLTPVLVGTSLAWAETGHFSWPAALAALIATLLLQIGINLPDYAPSTTLAQGIKSELFAFLFFGLLAGMGSYYLQTQDLSLNSLFAACAVGLQASAIRLVENYHDLRYGQHVNRFSVASSVGQQRTLTIYSALLLLPLLLLLPILFFRPVAGIALVTLSPTIRMIRFFCDCRQETELSRALTGTTSLQLIFGLALCIGLLLG